MDFNFCSMVDCLFIYHQYFLSMLQGTQSEWIAFLSPMADCRDVDLIYIDISYRFRVSAVKNSFLAFLQTDFSCTHMELSNFIENTHRAKKVAQENARTKNSHENVSMPSSHFFFS